MGFRIVSKMVTLVGFLLLRDCIFFFLVAGGGGERGGAVRFLLSMICL